MQSLLTKSPLSPVMYDVVLTRRAWFLVTRDSKTQELLPQIAIGQTRDPRRRNPVFNIFQTTLNQARTKLERHPVGGTGDTVHRIVNTARVVP